MLCAALTLTAAAQESRQYQIKVGDFTELYVMDNINVNYTNQPDGVCTVTFDATDPTASLVSVESKKEKLTLRLTDDGLKTTSVPTLNVCSTMLFKAQNNGDSTVTVTNTPHIPKFTGRLEGNGSLIVNDIDATEVNMKKFTGKGEIVVTGKCQTASLGNTGTGTVNCAGLKAEDSKCNILGTGAIYTCVSGTLSVTGVSGTIYYTGNPADIKSRALGVKLRAIEQLRAE